MVTIPTIDNFKGTTVMEVIRNVIDYIKDTFIPAVNTELNTKANDADLSPVAKSGSYNDLTNKPTIPPAVTVDNALSATSENPVQNKVINTAITQVNTNVTNLSGRVDAVENVNQTQTTDIQNNATAIANLVAYIGTDTELIPAQ